MDNSEAKVNAGNAGANKSVDSSIDGSINPNVDMSAPTGKSKSKAKSDKTTRKALRAAPPAPATNAQDGFIEYPFDARDGLMKSQPDAIGRVTACVALMLEGFDCDIRAASDADLEELSIAAMVGENPCQSTVTLIQLYRMAVFQRLFATPSDFRSRYERLIPEDRVNQSAMRVRTEIALARNKVQHFLTLNSAARPQIIAEENLYDIHKTLNAIEPHLASMDVYQRGHELVRVVMSNRLNSHAGKNDSHVVERPVINRHDVSSMTPILTEKIDFRRYKLTFENGQATRRLIKSAPPEALVKMLLRSQSYPSVPTLRAVVDGPFIRPDGSICNQVGYDNATGWFLSRSVNGIDVPDDPHECEARGCFERLERLVVDVPFKDRRDRATWIAGLLTLLARPSIHGPTPAFLITSNNIGTGKNLLINLMHTIAYGSVAPCNVPPQGHDNAREWQQTMFSFALSGVPFVWFDENGAGSNVGNSVLNKYLTSHVATERLFHKQESGECPWFATVFFTGNSLGIASDCARRVLPIVLQCMIPEPHKRPPESFAIPNIEQHVKDFRDEYLNAAFTMLRWHIRTGKTKPESLGGFASFESWSSMVRDCVARLTDDPAMNLEMIDVTVGDTSVVSHDASELDLLLSGLLKYQNARDLQIGKAEPWTVVELYNDMNHIDNHTTDWNGILSEKFDRTAKQHSFAVAVGTMLNRYMSRPRDGHFIAKSISHDKKKQYRIESIEDQRSAD